MAETLSCAAPNAKSAAEKRVVAQINVAISMSAFRAARPARVATVCAVIPTRHVAETLNAVIPTKHVATDRAAMKGRPVAQVRAFLGAKDQTNNVAMGWSVVLTRSAAATTRVVLATNAAPYNKLASLIVAQGRSAAMANVAAELVAGERKPANSIVSRVVMSNYVVTVAVAMRTSPAASRCPPA